MQANYPTFAKQMVNMGHLPPPKFAIHPSAEQRGARVAPASSWQSEIKNLKSKMSDGKAAILVSQALDGDLNIALAEQALELSLPTRSAGCCLPHG